MLINTGIKRVVCAKRYHAGGECEDMFRHVGIALEYFDMGVETYDKQ
jgi:dCMP deaminase